MPAFTMELWRIIEGVEDNPAEVAKRLGLNDYPIFDEAYRPTLNRAIVENFHNREIGQETVEMFRFAMGRKMRLIMPVYNQLYESARLEFDPLSTVNLETMSESEESQKAQTDGTSETATSNKAGSRAVAQDTPQVALKGDADYASGATDTTSTSNTDGSSEESSRSESNTEGRVTSRTTGYQGSASSLIMAFRETLINVDRMILAELNEDMFMLVWNSGDTYTETDWMF